jgi:hypothetical protein
MDSEQRCNDDVAASRGAAASMFGQALVPKETVRWPRNGNFSRRERGGVPCGCAI